MENIAIYIANESHIDFAKSVCTLIENAAKERGTGIAKRDPEYIKKKISEGKAVIALTQKNVLVGFCYIETWQHEKYVANSGLIVAPEYRSSGIAKKIKEKAFELSRQKYPNAKLFGLTTSLAVMKINSDLGYKPVTFSELTEDEAFWKGCQSCVNYDILNRTSRKHCLCTGMLYDQSKPKVENKFIKQPKLYERWMKIKKVSLFKKEKT